MGEHLATLADRRATQDESAIAKPLRDRCTSDTWSADARSCFATAQAPDELDGCRQKLTTEQRDALAKMSSTTLPAGGGAADPWSAK